MAQFNSSWINQQLNFSYLDLGGRSSSSSSSNQQQIYVGENTDRAPKANLKVSSSTNNKENFQRVAEKIKSQGNLAIELGKYFQSSFYDNLKKAIESLTISKLVNLYEEKDLEAFSAFDDRFKPIFGEKFSFVEFIKLIASNFNKTDLSRIINQDISETPLFKAFDEVIKKKLNSSFKSFSDIMQKNFFNKEAFIKRTFELIYGKKLVVSELEFLVDGKKGEIERLINPSYNYYVGMALHYGLRYDNIKKKQRGQRGRHSLLIKTALDAKKEIGIDDSELITSIEEFIDEFNQLLQQRTKYDNKKYIILSNSINGIIKGIIESILLKNENLFESLIIKNQLISFLEKNEELFNSFFDKYRSKNPNQVKEIISKLNSPNLDKPKSDKADQNWIVGKLQKIAHSLYLRDKN